MNRENASNLAEEDWIVHCHHGVGRIEAIERKRIGSRENIYYRIRMFDATMWIPADQMDDGQIRPLTDKKSFQEAVTVLNNPPRAMSSNMNTRNLRIRRVIAENVLTDTARLIRDLRARRRSKGGLNHNEWQALRGLTKRFVQEWSVKDGMSIGQARRKLNSNLSEGRRSTRSGSITTRNDRDRGQESALLHDLIAHDDKWVEWLNQQLSEEMIK